MTSETAAATAEALTPRRPWSEVARRVVLYLLLIGVALLFFVPFLWSLATSFKTIPDSLGVNLIPHPWTTAAWGEVWHQDSWSSSTLVVLGRNTLLAVAPYPL